MSKSPYPLGSAPPDGDLLLPEIFLEDPEVAMEPQYQPPSTPPIGEDWVPPYEDTKDEQEEQDKCLEELKEAEARPRAQTPDEVVTDNPGSPTPAFSNPSEYPPLEPDAIPTPVAPQPKPKCGDEPPINSDWTPNVCNPYFEEK